MDQIIDTHRQPQAENKDLSLEKDPFSQENPILPESKSFFQNTEHKSIVETVYPFTSKISDSTREQTITGFYDNNPYNSRLFEHTLKDGKLMTTKVFHTNGNVLHEINLHDGLVKSSKNLNMLGKVNLELKPLPKSNIFSGIEYNNDLNVVFKGEFVNGKRNGPGKEYNDLYVNITDGFYRDGKLQTHGVKYYDNGNKMYEGEFLNNLKSGYGISYYKNGKKKFDGYWLKDMYHGKGNGYYINGVISLEGAFIKGQKVNFFF